MPVKYEAPKLNPDFELPKLIEQFNGETFDIVAVRFGKSQFGEYAVVTVGKQKFVTGSSVLCLQLHSIAELIEKEKDTVTVTMKQVKRYYTF